MASTPRRHPLRRCPLRCFMLFLLLMPPPLQPLQPHRAPTRLWTLRCLLPPHLPLLRLERLRVRRLPLHPQRSRLHHRSLHLRPYLHLRRFEQPPPASAAVERCPAPPTAPAQVPWKTGSQLRRAVPAVAAVAAASGRSARPSISLQYSSPLPFEPPLLHIPLHPLALLLPLPHRPPLLPLLDLPLLCRPPLRLLLQPANSCARL